MMLRNQILVLKQFFSNQKMLYSTGANEQHNITVSLIHKLSQEYSDVAPIISTLKIDDVKYIDFNEWKIRIELLKNFNFLNKQCFQIITRYPSLLKIPKEDLETSLKQWSCTKLTTELYQSVLFKRPELLDIDSEEVRKRIPYLFVFCRTPVKLANLLVSTPSVMFKEWNEVMSKIKYLTLIRGYSPSDIISSKGLANELEYIKMRFELLEKCGIYKQETLTPHKINKYDKTKHINPPLKLIMQKDIKRFANNIANISVEEYIFYRELFGNSIKKLNDFDSKVLVYKDDENDDDDDDDDDE